MKRIKGWHRKVVANIVVNVITFYKDYGSPKCVEDVAQEIANAEPRRKIGEEMSDKAFRNELWIRCYTDQISGYPLGAPQRTNFQPIVPVISQYLAGNPADREQTLALPAYSSFTEDERALLLDRKP